MIRNLKDQSLTVKIIIAFSLGAVSGLLIKSMPDSSLLKDLLINECLYISSQLFVSSLKMLVVPMVFVSLVCGVLNLKSMSKIGRLGGKTLALYLSTTAIAISMAIGLALIFEPGAGFSLELNPNFKDTPPPPIRDMIANIIPSNPFAAAAEGEMLQIIIFALLSGAGISMAGNQGQKTAELFHEMNVIIMKILALLLNVVPFGVFVLMCKVFAEQGTEAIRPLLAYCLLVSAALLIQLFICYPALILFLSRLNPFLFLLKIRPVLMFAFSTASSNATIPLNLKVATEKLGVSRSVASFIIPLGATINMDGTAIMQGIATVFIAQAYQIDLGLSDYLTVILTATLASVGTAGAPGVGMITLMMVLRQAGLPFDGIGLIMGVDRILDMVRTAVNVAGDTVAACIVAKSEGELNMSEYQSPLSSSEI
ncbi:MAG: dicarboxylate/amino acid:cation symporter [Deltaproteobacteria bacterium]|nr:dicarboxylate/amino acid:cation symporter [Deltaproteobacteria bacterium]